MLFYYKRFSIHQTVQHLAVYREGNVACKYSKNHIIVQALATILHLGNANDSFTLTGGQSHMKESSFPFQKLMSHIKCVILAHVTCMTPKSQARHDVGLSIFSCLACFCLHKLHMEGAQYRLGPLQGNFGQALPAHAMCIRLPSAKVKTVFPLQTCTQRSQHWYYCKKGMLQAQCLPPPS